MPYNLLSFLVIVSLISDEPPATTAINEQQHQTSTAIKDSMEHETSAIAFRQLLPSANEDDDGDSELSEVEGNGCCSPSAQPQILMRVQRVQRSRIKKLYNNTEKVCHSQEIKYVGLLLCMVLLSMTCM